MFGPWLYPPHISPLSEAIYAEKVIQNRDRQNFVLSRQVEGLARENIDLKTKIIQMNAQKYADQLMKKRKQIQNEQKSGVKIVGYSKQILQKNQLNEMMRQKDKKDQKSQIKSKIVSKNPQKIQPRTNQSLDRVYSFSSLNANKQTVNSSENKRYRTSERRVQTEQSYKESKEEKYKQKKFQYLTLDQKKKHIEQKKSISRAKQQQKSIEKRIQQQRQIQMQLELERQKQIERQKKLQMEREKMIDKERQSRKMRQTQSQQKQTNKSIFVKNVQQRVNPQLNSISGRKTKEIMRIQTELIENDTPPRVEKKTQEVARNQQQNNLKILQTNSEVVDEENYLSGNGFKRDNRVYLQTSSIPERTYSPISKLKSIRRSNFSGNNEYLHERISVSNNTNSKKKFINVTTYKKLEQSQPQPIIKQAEDEIKN